MSLFDEVTQRITSQVSTRISSAIGAFNPASASRALAMRAVGKLAPKAYDPLNRALNGDFVGAALSAFDQTKAGAKVNDFLRNPNVSGFLSEAMGNKLYGGVTLNEARQIYAEAQSTAYAHKNLFFLEIQDYDPRVGASGGSNLFNMFATAVQIAPFNLSGAAKAIGSGQMDDFQGSERLELRVTTYDDAYGSIKRWFELRKMLAAHPDGTFGVPADYLVQVRILHSAINDQAMAQWGGYEQRFIMRCTSLETDLSRSEHGLQEIQLAFSQFDTFMFGQ